MLRRKRLADLPEHWDFGELTPGAQVRVRRSGYYHHGIYIGNGEIVHFDGSPNEQDAAAVRVRRTGMEEFLRGGLPERRIYGRAERKLLRAPGESAALERDVAQAILDGRARGGKLFTLLEKQGSAPRGPGARMLVLPDGSVLGTIGGGSAEYACITRAMACMGQTVSEVLALSVQSVGMTCGGSVKILMETL